jgi:hypothetical protein
MGIDCLAIDAQGNVYVAGDFTEGNGCALYGKRYVAEWNGTAWSELGGIGNSPFNNGIQDIVFDNKGNLYAVGAFTNGFNFLNGNQYIAVWNGTAWSELGGSRDSAFFNYWINGVVTDVNGNVYAAGWSTNNKGNNFVGKYDTNWSELGGSNKSTFNDFF